MSCAKNPPVCSQMSPRSSQMQKRRAFEDRQRHEPAATAAEDAAAARLRQRLDDDLVDVHVQRAGEREQDAVGDVLGVSGSTPW